MDLRQLRYFVVIAERGSFSAAAQFLNVAQSALSRHIQALEVELGGPLFERGTRGVSLSEPGQQLLDRARYILNEIETTRAEVSAQNRELSGTVRIGAPPSLAGVLYAPLAVRISKEHPKLHLRMIEGLTLDISDKLLSGALDLGIVSTPSPSDHLEFLPLFFERVFLIGPPLDPIFKRKSLSRAEVDGLTFVMSVEFIRRQFQKFSGTMHVDSIASVKNLVREGLGYGLVPSSGIEDEVANGTFGCVEVTNGPSLRAIGVSKGRPMSRAAKAVLAAIRQIFAQQISNGRIQVVER